jgi:hypothetical protein
VCVCVCVCGWVCVCVCMCVCEPCVDAPSSVSGEVYLQRCFNGISMGLKWL